MSLSIVSIYYLWYLDLAHPFYKGFVFLLLKEILISLKKNLANLFFGPIKYLFFRETKCTNIV